MIKRAIIILAAAALTGVVPAPAQANTRHHLGPCATNAAVSGLNTGHSRVAVETACGGGSGSGGPHLSFEEVSEAVWVACGRDEVTVGATPADGAAALGGLAAAGACYMGRMYGGSGSSPAQVAAARAVADLGIVAPEIGLTGYGRPESMQVLGLPTWMWVSDPGASTTGPVTSTATDAGVTVTATGRVREAVWQMGDGTTVTCTGTSAAGTPYHESYGTQPSPTCGHTYQRTSAHEPDRAFTVQVTVHWDVVWTGGGQSGALSTSVTRSTQLRVGEVQVITNGRGTDR